MRFLPGAGVGDPKIWSKLVERDDSGLLRIGEGVRELEDASDGEGVIDPSSDPFAEGIACSMSPTMSGKFLREERVLIVEGAGAASGRRRPGLVGVGATRCFGARGGLLASG